MNRRLIAIAILLTLVVPGLVAFSPVRQGPRLQLAVTAGYNGYFRQGQWTAVHVAVSNSGDDLDGAVRVRTGGLGGLAETTYSTPVDLPRGSRKQIFLYISLESYTQRLQVEVTDRQGKVVEHATADIRLIDRGDILTVVVTDSPYGAVDLTADTPGTGAAHQVNWQIDDIPPLADALSGLDVLMFHDVDTGTLKAEQVEAITNWVLGGGHLIVAGGDSWQRTTAGLQSLLPISSFQGTAPVSSLAPLADYLRVPREPLSDGATVTQVVPRAQANVLTRVGDMPLIVRSAYGDGVIDFLSVDPNAEPLRSWNQKAQLWYTLLASTGQRTSWSRGFSSWSVAREATLTMSSTVLPTFLQLCGFLALYIVLVGPVNYVVLKRLNRRELAWFTIPALIVGFSVLAYTVGFNLRGNVATVNRLSVVRVWPQGEQATAQTLIGVQSPRRGSYNVAVDRGYALRTLPDAGTGLGSPLTVNEGTRYVAESFPIDAGMVASFAADGHIPAPRVDGSATWHLSLAYNPRVTGSITNTTDMVLEDAVVLIKGESRFLGTIRPGDTRSFDIMIGPQDAGPLALGNPRNVTSLTYANPWQYAKSPGWCFSTDGLPLTVPDVMRDESFPCSNSGISRHEQEIRRRYRLLSALVVDTDVSGGRDTGVYLFAWTNGSPVNVELLDRPQGDEDTTLYIFDLPVKVVAHDSQIEIPPGLTTWTIIETNDPLTQLEVTPTNFRIGSNGQAAFGFMPMPQMRLGRVDELAIQFQAQAPLKIELWDWDNQEWVAIDSGVGTNAISITSPESFVGPENAVNVRVIPQDFTSYNQVDFVKVSYRGQLAG